SERHSCRPPPRSTERRRPDSPSFGVRQDGAVAQWVVGVRSSAYPSRRDSFSLYAESIARGDVAPDACNMSGTAPPRSEPDPPRWWALALLCGAFFMVILDAAIVTVALPSIEEKLGFSAQGLQWVVSAYALTFAGLLLLGGRAADLLGRRRVFMVGVVLFTLASLLCGLAWSDRALIGARAFQGIGAAVMTPSALSIITTTFEEGTERNKALGIWGALGGIGATT